MCWSALPGGFLGSDRCGGPQHFTEMICDAAQSRVVGYGLDEGVQMGPVISQVSRQRIEGLIGSGAEEGATVCVDGAEYRY